MGIQLLCGILKSPKRDSGGHQQGACERDGSCLHRSGRGPGPPRGTGFLTI
jgi:hypothetical protein